MQYRPGRHGGEGFLGHKRARNTGARLIASMSKKKGIDVTVRFTSGWSVERMIDFAEGMLLRDYEFLEHQESPKDHISDLGTCLSKQARGIRSHCPEG